METPHTYDLAFIAPQPRPRTNPEIVFIIDARHFPELIDRLQTASAKFRDYALAYLAPFGKQDSDFHVPIPDLFGNQEFGYQNCGHCTAEDGYVYLRLELRPRPWANYCSLTISVLTRILATPFQNGAMSNREQDATLFTHAEWRSTGYDHIVGGWLSESVLNWMKVYAKSHISKHEEIWSVPMHPQVVRAMRTTWCATAPPDLHKYAGIRDTFGIVSSNGAFSLNCFGNACDLSVYPDQYLREGCESVTLGCHNLDSSYQQLTLLAGLATICQLVRAET